MSTATDAAGATEMAGPVCETTDPFAHRAALAEHVAAVLASPAG